MPHREILVGCGELVMVIGVTWDWCTKCQTWASVTFARMAEFIDVVALWIAMESVREKRHVRELFLARVVISELKDRYSLPVAFPRIAKIGGWRCYRGRDGRLWARYTHTETRK